MWMGTTCFHVLVAGSEAEEMGRTVGGIIWPVILIAGLLKCQAIARRPTANRKCIYALSAVLIGFLISTIFGLIFHEAKPDPLLAVGIGLLLFAATLVSILLAILGLVELREKKDEPRQGKRQAIWAIVLSVLMWALLGGGAVSAIRNRQVLSEDLQKVQPRVESDLTFEPYNYKFKVPPRPWQAIEAGKINRDATLAFLRGNPVVYMMILSEKVDPSIEMSSETLASIAKAHLQSVARNINFVSEGAFPVKGMNGFRTMADLELSNQKFHQINWAYTHNGFLYQIVLWGAQGDRKAIADAFGDLSKRFELIDAQRVAQVKGKDADRDIRSSEFPCMLRIAGTPWMPWCTLAKDLPDADLGAKMDPFACVIVIAVNLMGQDPPQESLVSGLLTRIGIDYPGQELSNLKDVTVGPLKGTQFDFQRTVDQASYRYRCQALRGDGQAYLVEAWIADDGKGERERFLDEGLRLFSVDTAAPGPLPLEKRSERSRRTQAWVLNDMGVHRFNAKQYPQSIPLYAAALESNSNDLVILDNLLNAYAFCQREEEALAILEKNRARFPGHVKLLARRAHLLAALERTEDACAAFAELFAGDHADDNDFEKYVDLLAELKQFDRAVAALEKYRLRNDSVPLLLKQALVLSAKGAPKEAIALLRERQKKIPFNAEIAFALTEYLSQTEEYAEGLKVCQQLLDNGFDSAQAWFNKGIFEENLKWYTQAKASFEMALKRAPRDKTAQKWLDYVSGVLGEGNNSGLKNAIAPVPFPPAWLERGTEGALAEDLKEYSACYLRRLTAISFVAGKDYRVTEHRLVKVRDMTGVARFSTFQFGFDPLSEEIYMNTLVVRDGEGRVVSTGKVSDCYVIDEGGNQATQRKTLNIPVPGLLPGHSIELTVTRRDLAPPERLPIVTRCFSSTFPALYAGLHVCGDVKDIAHRATAGVDLTVTPQALDGLIERPPLYRLESNPAETSRFLPTVWLNGAGATWKDVGNAILTEIAPTLTPDPAVAPVAATLLQGRSGDREKREAIVQYVQDNYTYRAIEFGRRAHVPNAPAVILRNRYGDCKDHALLLHHLFAQAGLTSHLALVCTGLDFQEDMPSVEQFDHMILHYIDDGRDRFLDATDKDGDLSATVPYGLGGRRALILEQDRSRLVRIPDYAPDVNVLKIARALSLDAKGNLSVRETVAYHGHYAASMRGYLKAFEPAHRKETMQSILAGHQESVELQSFDIGDLEVRSKPLVLQMTYLCRGCFQAAGDPWVGQLPAPWERCYLEEGTNEQRHTPFRYEYPLVVESALTFELSDGFQTKDTAPWEGHGESAPFRWSLTGSADRARLTAQFRATRSAGCFDADGYAAYLGVLREAITALRRNVVLSKEKK